MVVTLSGIVMRDRDVQSSNALVSMVVMLSGISTLVRLVHSSNV